MTVMFTTFLKKPTQEMSVNLLSKLLSNLLIGLKQWACGKHILKSGKGETMEASDYIDIQGTLLEIIEEIKELRQRVENLEKEKV